jgi:hypothetical protein
MSQNEVSDFQNFVNSAANTSGGTGAGYLGPPPPLNVLPPVNMSQVGGVAPYTPSLPSNTVSNTNNILNPLSSSSSSSSSSSDPYDRFRKYKFNPNFSTNNCGAAYDPTKRMARVYDTGRISKDQYGQNYDVSEPILTGFKDRLKRTKKSRYANEHGMTYGELATRRETRPNQSDAIWAMHDKTNFGEQYEIGKKYRNRSVDEIKRKKDNQLEIYAVVEKDDSLDKKDKGVQNLLYAVQNRATHVRQMFPYLSNPLHLVRQ